MADADRVAAEEDRVGAEEDRPGVEDVAPSRLRLVLVALAGFGSLAALLFVPAGRLDWTAGWVHLGMVVAHGVTTWACLRRWNPTLIEHRLRLGPGTKTWDKVWSLLYAPIFLSLYGVASLDAARPGGGVPSPAAFALGSALFVAGATLLTASMVVNPFFEKTVRIQAERGHRVIDTGPYRLVRHPGYAGFLGWILSVPLLLGSARAFWPAAAAVAGLVVRTALEDRTLRRELEGYAEYARRVRHRLVPGVW